MHIEIFAETQKSHQVRSNVMVMLIIFFGYECVVHHEILPKGQTVNKELYLEFLKRLRESTRKKMPESWKVKRWLFHHDSALAHTSLLFRDFLTKAGTTVLPQPPFSPDLAPTEFFLFSKLKSTFKGR
jgi:histone-lysine N-methyltransferase SETMAR